MTSEMFDQALGGARIKKVAVGGATAFAIFVASAGVSACSQLLIARLVGAAEYHRTPACRTFMWAYFDGAEVGLRQKEFDLLATLVACAGVTLRAVATSLQIPVTAGDNPHRLRSEAAFAMLCGVAPLPASSGRTNRHRLNRGGDRQANAALHRIVVCRLRWDPRSDRRS